MDNDNKVISSVIVYIDGEEFNTQWNTDEDLVNIVLAKLGLTRAP
jgi:hypothetical protein